MAALWMRLVVATWALAIGLPAQQAENPVDLVKQGRKLVADGRYDEALALYKRAIATDAKSFDAHLAAGVALDLKGECAAARVHLARAIELAPEASQDEGLAAMAVSYAFEAKAADAARFYQKVFDKQLAAQSLDAAAATANALGRIYLEAGDLVNAERWYRTGHETARKQGDLKPEQIDLWDMRWLHAQARIAARRGDAAEAKRQVAALRKYIDKITPGGPNADQLPIYPYLLGYVAFYLKDYSGAIAELLKGDQTDPFILGLVAQAYETTGDPAKAREYYRKVLATHSHTINTAYSRPLARKALS